LLQRFTSTNTSTYSDNSTSVSVIRRAPSSTPFPYTTLFRTHLRRGRLGGAFRQPRVRWHGHAEDARRGLRGNALRGQFQLRPLLDRKSTRLNSSHVKSSYAVFYLERKR